MCAYGKCTMVNLCKHGYCVREQLERDGWVLGPDGDLEKVAPDPAPKREGKEP